MYSTLLILPTKANNSILIPVIRPHESQVQRCLDLFKAIKNMFVITISHPVIAGCISHYTLPDRVRINTTSLYRMRYLNTYNLYYFHIITSDPYDETRSSKIGDLDVTDVNKGENLS